MSINSEVAWRISEVPGLEKKKIMLIFKERGWGKKKKGEGSGKLYNILESSTEVLVVKHLAVVSEASTDLSVISLAYQIYLLVIE